MAGQPDITQILEQLRATSQQQQGMAPNQGQQAPAYPPPQTGYNMPPGNGAPGHYAPPPTGYPSYPQPSNSGTLNLDSIKPVTSGTVSLQDAIAKAKAVAAANNIAPYERAPVYGSQLDGANDGGPRQWGRSRSRSPPRRDSNNYRDSNPYRDERRDDRPPRDYGHHNRDRSYSPGPRGGRQGGAAFSDRGANPARQRSPLRDHDSETMSIEASLVGLIIGRQGENLRRVEAETKCRVQFLPPQSKDETYRQCKITGPRASRAEATAAINRIIDDSGMGAIARAGLDRGGPRVPAPAPVVDRGGIANLKDGEDCVQIMVPDRTVGLIIGRGGETIRDLQERSGCHVNIVGEQKSVNGLRPVNLIGPYAATAQAKEMIMEIVESDARNAAGGGSAGGSAPPQGRPQRDDRDKAQDAIFVPNEAVGMIIGKGGETIREMQNTTGCKINVSQQPQPGQSDREIELVGTRDAINQAKAAIEEKVEAVKQKSNGGFGDRGGGGRGGRGGHSGHGHRDYDNPGRGQSSNQYAGDQGAPAAQAQQLGADGQADPYAPYGGYQNYLALWYQSLAQQNANAAGGAQGDATQPPGTS